MVKKYILDYLKNPQLEHDAYCNVAYKLFGQHARVA